jgi:dCTP deaminase
MALHLARPGVLPSQMIAGAISDGWVTTFDGSDIPDQNIQPASLDLRLGTVAYRLRCSFLPDNEPVEEALRRYKTEQIKPRPDGSWTLEQNRPYLIPLVERLSLPEGVRAKANPKSSTGRLDIFTRVITDNSYMFDEIPSGYHGRLYLEVVSRTFTVRVRRGLSLNQLRLMYGRTALSDDDIWRLHERFHLLYRNGKPMDPKKVAVNNGLFMSLDLGRSSGGDLVGYSAKADCHDIDLSKINHYKVSSYWDEVRSEGSDHGARIVLRPEKFYLLLSQEGIKIPPEYAAEMTAYDPTSGELRTHYAGFFDPGFGFYKYNSSDAGSRAALEVRAHDVQFAVEHGQNICKLSFDKMIEVPERLYGNDLRSNYQGQQVALGKHFRRGKQEQREDREERKEFAQASLFPLEEAAGLVLE